MTPSYPPVPFDPELEAALAAAGEVAMTTMTPDLIAEKRRVQQATTPTIEELVANRGIEVERVTLPSADADVVLDGMLLRPTGTPGALPGVLYVHGGGMVSGNMLSGASVWLDLVDVHHTAVLTFEYRLAPEHPHPTPVDDCFSALRWLAGNAAEAGIDPGRLLVAGASAGGGIAAALALMARDRGGPSLYAQLLIYPMLDDRNTSVSSHQIDRIGVWDRTSNITAWDALLGPARGGPEVSPYAAPARASELAGLPPAFIDVGSADVFRDEAVEYASRIWQAGGNAELHVWPGAFHGYDVFTPDTALARATKAARDAWLSRLLSG